MMRKEFESLPSPSEYEDWKSWAAILISSLSERGNQSALNIPVFVKDETKRRKGLPPAEKGDLIWLLDGGVRKLAVWDGKGWITYAPETQASPST